jgi:hypothetical protein
MCETGRHHNSATCTIAAALLTRIVACLRNGASYELRDIDGSRITEPRGRAIVVEAIGSPPRSATHAGRSPRPQRDATGRAGQERSRKALRNTARPARSMNTSDTLDKRLGTQRPRAHRQCAARLVSLRRRRHRLHRARLAVGEPLGRVLRQPHARRAGGHRAVRHPARGSGPRRRLADRVQHLPPSLRPRHAHARRVRGPVEADQPTPSHSGWTDQRGPVTSPRTCAAPSWTVLTAQHLTSRVQTQRLAGPPSTERPRRSVLYV